MGPYHSIWCGCSTRYKTHQSITIRNIMFSYPTRSGVNAVEILNLKIKVGDNVVIVYVISQISRSKLLIVVLGQDMGRGGGGM